MEIATNLAGHFSIHTETRANRSMHKRFSIRRAGTSYSRMTTTLTSTNPFSHETLIISLVRYTILVHNLSLLGGRGGGRQVAYEQVMIVSTESLFRYSEVEPMTRISASQQGQEEQESATLPLH